MKERDTFEEHLRRQALRPVPTHWRNEILAAAEANRHEATRQPVSEDQAALFAGLRLLLARVPLAWGSLAALWIVLAGVNLALPSPPTGAEGQASGSVRMATLAALDLLAPELDLVSEPGIRAPQSVPTPKPSEVPNRPRSERWRGLDFGGADHHSRLNCFV